MAAIVRRMNSTVAGLGSPVVHPDAFADDVVRLLTPRIDRWLWAGGQKTASSPLTMRDVARGDSITGLGGGSLVASGAAYNDHAYISLPGGATTSGLRLDDHSWPGDGFAVLMHFVWSGVTSPQYILSRSGSNPQVAVTPATHAMQWKQGPGGVVVLPTSHASIAPNTASLILISYDAGATHGRIYVNSTSHIAESYVLPNIVPGDFYTYIAGSNSPQNVTAGMSNFLLLNEPLHGDNDADVLRIGLVGLFAAYYDITLT